MAVGTWEVQTAISVGLVAFLKEAGERRASRQQPVKALEEMLDRDFTPKAKAAIVDVFVTFAECFGRKARSERDYLVTAAYFNSIVGRPLSRRQSRLEGLAYPSVKAQLEGDNIALLPSVADTALKLIDVHEILFSKNGERVWVDAW